MNIFCFRVRFTKTGKVRFLSHHDSMRMFERALRRSGLPLRFTSGFHPHPIMAFPLALGVGIESVDEVMEFELSSWVAPRKIEEDLGGEFPEGVTLKSVETFERKKRSFVDFVEYEASGLEGAESSGDRVKELFEEEEIWIERASDKKTRQINIRPYMMSVEYENERLLMRIQVTDRGTAKPDEIIRAIGLQSTGDTRVRKTFTQLGIRGA